MFRTAFSLCNFSDKAVQMQTMKTARHSRPTYHKRGNNILIYGPIKKNSSSTESLKCPRFYISWIDSPSIDTKLWYIDIVTNYPRSSSINRYNIYFFLLLPLLPILIPILPFPSFPLNYTSFDTFYHCTYLCLLLWSISPKPSQDEQN